MNKHNNHRPPTISQPNQAASVKELSAEAMEDINSISAGEFSTIKPISKKAPILKGDALPSLDNSALSRGRNHVSSLDDLSFGSLRSRSGEPTLHMNLSTEALKRESLDKDDSEGDIIEINIDPIPSRTLGHGRKLNAKHEQLDPSIGFEEPAFTPEDNDEGAFEGNISHFSALDDPQIGSLPPTKINDTGEPFMPQTGLPPFMSTPGFQDAPSFNGAPFEYTDPRGRANHMDMPPEDYAPEQLSTMPESATLANPMAPQGGGDPFLDPAFLAAQTAKPTFYQHGKTRRSSHSVQAQTQERDLGYVLPGVASQQEPDKNNLERFHINKEEVERRTQEIWGTGELSYAPQVQVIPSDPNMGTDIATQVAPESPNYGSDTFNSLQGGVSEGDGEIHTHIFNGPTPERAKPDFKMMGAPKSQSEYIRAAAAAAAHGNASKGALNTNASAAAMGKAQGPSTLINGYNYDLQNKSQAEVRQGLDRIIQKTSQNMKPHDVAQNGGSIVAADMYKGSRYEANIAKNKNHSQINTKISGLVASEVAKNSRAQSPDNLVSTVIMHGKPNQNPGLNFSSRDHGTSVTASQLNSSNIKNTKTILSDSKGRILEEKKPRNANNMAFANKTVASPLSPAQAIDFSFSSKPTNITGKGADSLTSSASGPSAAAAPRAMVSDSDSSDKGPSTTISKGTGAAKIVSEPRAETPSKITNLSAERSSATPIISLDSMLQPVSKPPKEALADIASQAKGRDGSSKSAFNFDFDQSKKASDIRKGLSKHPEKLSHEEQIDELDSLLSSLEEFKTSKKESRPKLFDVPALFESNDDSERPEGPLKIKPDFYTDSDSKPTILNVNPLENPPSVTTKVDDKNLDLELPDLKDQKGLHSSESLSELKDLGHALRSLTDSLSSKQPTLETAIEIDSTQENPRLDDKLSDESDSEPIDAFSNLVASADERFGPSASESALKSVAERAQAQAAAQASAASANVRAPAASIMTMESYLAGVKNGVMQCAYLGQSGLDLGTIERFNLGYDDLYQVATLNDTTATWQALIVPLDSTSFVAYNCNELLSRTTGESERHYVGQCSCLNLQYLNGQELQQPLFICAYELDALALESLGYKAMSLGSPYNVLSVLNSLQNLCNGHNLAQIFKAPCYICLPANSTVWQSAQEALMAAFKTLQLAVAPLDLTCACPTIYQALAFNKSQLVKTLVNLQESFTTPQVPFTIASSPNNQTPGLVLSLESLAKLELGPTLYALSSSSIALSRLVMASLVENKFSPLVYAGSAMQWQMLCSLLSSPQGMSPIDNSPLEQLLGYKAQFLALPWEMNLTKIDACIVQALQAKTKSSEGPCAFMIDTFGYDPSLCSSLAPRFAQLAMEFKLPIVAWCSQEQKSIFAGNAFQSIEMSQGSPNEIIFRTTDSACRTHMFSTGN